MGSVIITIADSEEGIEVQMGFDPPIADTEEVESLAHAVALDFVEYATLKYAQASEAEWGATLQEEIPTESPHLRLVEDEDDPS